MAMPYSGVQINQKLTADDLAQMPDDGNRYELIEGELVVSAAPTLYHQRAVSLLDRALGALEVLGIGFVFPAPVEVRLSPWTAVEPALVFVKRERSDILDWSRRINGAPDLVIEVISPTNASQDTVRKADIYAKHQVPEYWLFDPMSRSVSAYMLTGDRYTPIPLSEDGTIHSRVLPSFTLDPVAFFRHVFLES